MKKIMPSLVLTYLLFGNFSYCLANEVSMALCTQGNKMCAIGKHILSTNNPEGLYVLGGIVCTPDKKICTNGHYMLRSNINIIEF